MHMGMQDAALVPAEQIAVRGQQIVQRHPCLEQQTLNVCPLSGVRSKTEVRWVIGTIAPEPGSTPSASPAWARMPGSLVETNMQCGVSIKISAALIQL
jgi:hypothetical protein